MDPRIDHEAGSGDPGHPAQDEPDRSREPGAPAPELAGTTGSRRWSMRRPSLFAVAFTVSVLAFLALRLGPSLVGSRVFAGLDVFDLFAPWSHLPGAADPVLTSTFVTDQIDANFPAMHEVRERLRSGDLAWWSSMVGGGVALLGTINLGMISPGRFFFFLLPTELAPAWAKLGEMGFAAAFTYLLVRRLGGSRSAGALAGFVYPMTGFIIGWTNWTQTAVAAVVPMLFWAIERLVQERRVSDVVPVAIATALLMLGGFPAVAGQTLYVAAAYAVVRLLTAHGAHVGRIVRDGALLLAAVVLGLALSAVQLFPFVAATLGDVDLSYREGGFFDQVPKHYMLTSVFGDSFTGNDLAAPASPMDLNAYVGGVVVILAVLGLLQLRHLGRHATAGLFMAAVLVVVVGLLWFQGAWSAWLGDLPIFSGNPIGRIRSQLGLPAAVLAAFGVDWIIRAGARGGSDAVDASRGARLVERWVGALAALVVTAVVTVAAYEMITGRIIGTGDNVRSDIVWTLVPMAVVTVLLMLLATVPAARGVTVAVVAVAVVVQAVPATRFYWPTADPAKFYATSEGIELLQAEVGHDRIATLGHAIRPNTTHYYGIRVLNGHLFAPSALASVFTAIDPNAFIGPTYSIFSPNVAEVADSPGLDRFGVRYLVAQADSVQPGFPGTPVLIPGVADPLDPPASTQALVPGGIYVAALPAGALRGVHIPLEVTGSGVLSVEVRGADGAVLARNTRKLGTTAGLREVPMALSFAGEPAQGPWSVAVVLSDGARAVGTFDDAGDLRVQAVRDFPAADPADDGLSVAFAGEGMIIWERDDYLPRIRFATRADVIPDDDERVEAVATRPAVAGEVILEEDPAVSLRPGGDPDASLEILEDSGDVVRVRTSSSAPGFVVVSDTIQLDFAASVDGLEAQIVPADHAGGAVLVPAGDHVVEITYASAEQRVGAVVTGASALVLVLLLVVPGVLARRRLRIASGGALD